MKLTPEEKEHNVQLRRLAKEELVKANELAKELADIEAEKNQKPVKGIMITIEWKNQKLGGLNPHAEAQVSYHDGTHTIFSTSCTGCGYDKRSYVIGEIMNKFLKYKLYLIEDRLDKPYGMIATKDRHYFSEGCGTSSMIICCSFIGGELTEIASGITFDVYKYEDKN